ncbi:stabilizer of axonemal microtubules 1 [Podargus strigoides]
MLQIDVGLVCKFQHSFSSSEGFEVNKIPFDGLTTRKLSYKGLAGQPAELVKPYQLKLLRDRPFSSTTKFKEKYQAFPQSSVVTKKPCVYLPPLEKMAKICLSFAHLKKSTKPFNSSSIMKKDYKPWLCKRSKSIVHALELTFSAKPMGCLTTCETYYVPHPVTVMKSYKPGWSGPKYDTLLDAKPIDATSYTPKGFVRCLASYKPGYVFEGNDDGHHFYLPEQVPAGWTLKEEESGYSLLGNGGPQ